MTNPLPDIDQIPAIRDYEGLRKALAAARRARGMSQLGLDYVAGLASGHTGKLECGTKGFGPLSLSLVLEALGVELTVSGPPARMFSKHVKLPPINSDLPAEERNRLARKKGGIVRSIRMNPQARRASARKAAKSRWARARARKKANAK